MDDKKVSATDVYKLLGIFNTNNWFNKIGHEDVLKNFIEMMENFTDIQKQLIYELSEKYLWITFSEYPALLLKTLALIEDEKIKNCKRAILFPIVQPKDIGKVKSANSLLYLFKSTGFAGERYKNLAFKIVDSYKRFEQEQLGEGDLLLLVDDYIGSGDTLKVTIDEVLKNNTVIIDKINIVALVTQQEIFSTIGASNISFYSLHVLKKAISDCYVQTELETKRSLMHEIEELIPKVGEYSFGYKQTEALVTMSRTPNNTFPIFWRNHKKGGKVFKAPFSR